MTDQLTLTLSGRKRLPTAVAPGAPLIIAIHGGSYTSAYFDVPGYSLLDRAVENGVPGLALDRPGYGNTAILRSADSTITGNAHALLPIIEDLWLRYGIGTRGVFLIGHSIGAAIAATIASAPGTLPLLGIALSGVGLRVPDGDRERWEALPDIPLVDLPAAIKDMVMFGPEGSFDPQAQLASHQADAPAVRAELVDITSTWSYTVHDVLGAITVPVHYRQGEFDRLWIVDQGEIDSFAAAILASPRVDAAMLRGTGHCMDFHHIAAALQAEQIGFALRCAAEAANLATK